jgi:hypothetical protein
MFKFVRFKIGLRYNAHAFNQQKNNGGAHTTFSSLPFKNFADPKSTNFGVYSLSKRIFCGLMSRWRMVGSHL